MTTDYNRKWHALSAVSTGVFLATIDGSIVNVSLPTMAASLHTNFTVIQWVVLSYLLSVTTLMLGFGRLGDILGKKRIYLAGFTIFTLSSGLCGFAASVVHLIALRIVQGAGSAMIMAMGAALVTEAFPPRERGRAMGVIGAVVSVGIVTGPALGGVIIDLLSWHWIFFVNLPVGIVGIWMVRRFIPAPAPLKKQAFDFAGAVILFAALICFLLGLSLGQQYGFGDRAVLALLAAASVFMAGFIRVELKAEQPMIDLTLFRNALLCINLFTGFITFVALGGVLILMPFYLEVILGYSTMKVGMLLSVIPVMMGIFSPISGNLSDRLGSRPITLAGLIVLLAGYLTAGTLGLHTDETGFMLKILMIGMGTGLFLSPNNSAIMGAGSKHQLGVVSGLMAVSRTLGQTVGISVIATLWAVRIRVLTGNWELTDVTRATPEAQVQGLQYILILVAAMILAAVGTSVAGYVLERKRSKPAR